MATSKKTFPSGKPRAEVMREQEVLTEMMRLEGLLDQRYVKYTRNLMRYHGNNMRREQVYETHGSPLGYFFSAVEDDVGPAPSVNVLQSMIESSVSKLSQLKVRPFLNPVNGSYQTKRVCREGQVFFDELYDRQDVYSKARLSLRDAEIFEYGVHWIDDETRQIRRVRPWEFYCEPSEYTFGELTHCHLKFTYYPLVYLKDKITESDNRPRFESIFSAQPFPERKYRIYFDLLAGERLEFIENDLLLRRPIEYDVAPFSFIWYHPPVRGFKSTSLVDAQIRTQEKIDEINDRIAIALTLTPANTVMVPIGSDIKVSQVTNQIGQFLEYRPVPGQTGPAIEVVTPPAIHDQFVQMMHTFIQLAYDMEGISQLSAQSKKPAGITSGVALQTLEDVESERHQVIVENYKRFLMRDAELAIDVFPASDDILPQKQGRAKVKFGDIKKERDAFTVQFSANNFLSKDPSTKMGEIQKLLAMHFITPNMASDYMDLPDQNAVDSIIGSSYAECERVIERAITDGSYDVPITVDYSMLFTQICTTYNRLDSNDESREALERLTNLLKVVQSKIQETEQAQNPPPPPPGPGTQNNLPPPAQPAPGGAPGAIPVQGAPAPVGAPPGPPPPPPGANP